MGKVASRTDWENGFLFVGNELVLDFVNTRPVQDGKPMELLKDFGVILRWFQAAELLRPGEVASLEQQWGGTARAQKITEAMWELREKLRAEILSWEHGGAIRGSTIGDLNVLLADHPMRTKLKASGTGHLAELWFEVREPKDLFAPLAHSAATLFTTVDRKRVRKCVFCVLHFHDTSKKGTRRWCSMRLCGNRLKVAAYAARQRKHK